MKINYTGSMYAFLDRIEIVFIINMQNVFNAIFLNVSCMINLS